jgi:hypothetical protein
MRSLWLFGRYFGHESPSTDERLKLQKELIAARDRQAAAGKAQGAAVAEPVKPQ